MTSIRGRGARWMPPWGPPGRRRSPGEAGVSDGGAGPTRPRNEDAPGASTGNANGVDVCGKANEAMMPTRVGHGEGICQENIRLFLSFYFSMIV